MVKLHKVKKFHFALFHIGPITQRAKILLDQDCVTKNNQFRFRSLLSRCMWCLGHVEYLEFLWPKKYYLSICFCLFSKLLSYYFWVSYISALLSMTFKNIKNEHDIVDEGILPIEYEKFEGIYFM